MEPKKYRKKPPTIEAVLFDGNNGLEIYTWASNNGASVSFRNLNKTIVIDTDELSEMTAVAGDYIIKTATDNFSVCKPEVFKATYEEVSDDVQAS